MHHHILLLLGVSFFATAVAQFCTPFMQAIEKKVPVSRESLYTRHGLPRPVNPDDTFLVDSDTSIALSDSSKKNDTQKYISF